MRCDTKAVTTAGDIDKTTDTEVSVTKIDEPQLNIYPAPEVDEAVPLRLATWNLNHWRQPTFPTDTRRSAWEYLAGTIRTQVVLVQEAVPPLGLDARRVVYGEMAGHRNWGSGVVSLDPAVCIDPLRSVRMPWSRRRFLLTNTHPGSVAIGQPFVPGIQGITLISVYGVLDGSAVSTMLRVIADLVPLFDSPYGSRVIFGGDLNISTATTNPRNLARAEAVLAAIRSLGLVDAKSLIAERPQSALDCSCGHGGTCSHIATWGQDELDHLFVSPSLAGQVTGVSVDGGAAEAGLSDHLPLVLDLALSRERTPHGWDEESFAEEIGRRHGAAARDVIEKLVNWADQKEREVATSTGVRTKTLTRFPTNGNTTEPEMWCQVDLDLEPKGAQSTISVRAGGDVVVQFGSMRHPPFDSMPDIGPNLEGALLGLIEAYQRLGRSAAALATLRRLQALAPDDPVVRLSLAELLVHGQPAERAALEEAAHLGENVPYDSAIHAAIRLYRATAMRELGLPDAATSLLSDTLRRTADRPDELLHALRYERALAYDAAGQTKWARAISSASTPRHPTTRMSRGA